MEIRPENPYEKAIFDAAYHRLRGWCIVGTLLAPGIPLYPIWSDLVDALSIEVVGGLVVVMQLALVATLPDRIALYLAQRELVTARAGGVIPHYTPPKPKAPPEPKTFAVNVRYSFTDDPGTRTTRVKDQFSGEVRVASPKDREHLRKVMFNFFPIDRLSNFQREECYYRARLGFCLATFDREPGRSQFRNTAPDDLAQQIVTMIEKRWPRE